MLMSTSSSKDFGDLKISTTYTPSFFCHKAFSELYNLTNFPNFQGMQNVSRGSSFTTSYFERGEGKIDRFLGHGKKSFCEINLVHLMCL